MVFNALHVLRQQLSDYIGRAPDLISDGGEPVVICPMVKSGGEPGVPEGKLGLTLANIEEERTVKAQPVALADDGGGLARMNPELRLNLYVLLSANFPVYATGLKVLSRAIQFFQGKNVFTGQDSPQLAPEIEKLIVELHTLSFEQQNHMWAALGAKYLPSVMYRVRMLALQDSREVPVAPITEVNVTRHEIGASRP